MLRRTRSGPFGSSWSSVMASSTGRSSGPPSILRKAARSDRYEDFGSITRALPTTRRSVTTAGRRLADEQVMLLRRPSPRTGQLIQPNYRLFPYERQLQTRELIALGASPVAEGEGVAVATDAPGLSRVAFGHGWRKRDGTTHHTRQRLFEAADASTRRKNSTYFLHGLHRYKGKFFPACKVFDEPSRTGTERISGARSVWRKRNCRSRGHAERSRRRQHRYQPGRCSHRPCKDGNSRDGWRAVLGRGRSRRDAGASADG